MSKNQDNASSISDETTEAEIQEYEEFLTPLEDIRVEFEKKSVEEIKKSSILDLAKYFCAAYKIIEKCQQTQSENLSGPETTEERKPKVYIYQQYNPDINKFIAAFDVLKTKLQVVLNSNYGNSDIDESFKTWVAATKGCLNKVQKEDFNNFFSKTPEVVKPPIEKEMFLIVLAVNELVERTIYQEYVENITNTTITEEQKSTIEICDKELPEEIAVSNITEPLQILGNTLDTVHITGDNSDSDDNV